MQSRVPSARPIASGVVTHRQLRFHKRGRDSSAKADAFWTGFREHRIWGVVYEIPVREKGRLDECESLGVGYDETEVQVLTRGVPEVLTATLYVARPEAISNGLPVYGWYLAYVESGARAHGCPDGHLQHLESVPSSPDPDRQRAEFHARQLERVEAASLRDSRLFQPLILSNPGNLKH